MNPKYAEKVPVYYTDKISAFVEQRGLYIEGESPRETEFNNEIQKYIPDGEGPDVVPENVILEVSLPTI